jgi:hypothetical protein
MWKGYQGHLLQAKFKHNFSCTSVPFHLIYFTYFFSENICTLTLTLSLSLFHFRSLLTLQTPLPFVPPDTSPPPSQHSSDCAVAVLCTTAFTSEPELNHTTSPWQQHVRASARWLSHLSLHQNTQQLQGFTKFLNMMGSKLFYLLQNMV